MHYLKHFKTITRHRHEVIKNCFKCGIGFQGLFHDLSKYSYTEFIVGGKYYVGTKSPNDTERKLFGYSSAWLHHKGRNKHHYEYWFDYDRDTHIISPVKMPIRYVKEMFCDRIAACKIYGGENYTNSNPLDYFLNSKARLQMNVQTAELLEKWLVMLSEKGEKETFDYIKKIKDEKE